MLSIYYILKHIILTVLACDTFLHFLHVIHVLLGNSYLLTFTIQ